MSYWLSAVFILCVALLQTRAQAPQDPGLIQSIKPNFDAVKGLICYQCKSVSNELQPLCDKTIFKLATPEEKYNMSLQCPHYQGSYCFTKVSKRGKQTETTRGCSGPTDKNGNLMKVGCMTTKDLVLCLCDKKFCNKATPTLLRKISVVFVLATMFTILV
ncbi:hypothetical protein Zmor_021285 [Zophobas morio]|uniref:Protein sleepless n=1 Tax=Zophobas morio TaxID=2755281 RepID=A0AA38I537_9CUCU|nr:hypothetical protein Zmor_021285 [Zophobas morio]